MDYFFIYFLKLNNGDHYHNLQQYKTSQTMLVGPGIFQIMHARILNLHLQSQCLKGRIYLTHIFPPFMKILQAVLRIFGSVMFGQTKLLFFTSGMLLCIKYGACIEYNHYPLPFFFTRLHRMKGLQINFKSNCRLCDRR